MPGNLTIAAFLFGAVLILLALVGGRFKLFGAEVSGTVGRFARILAFVFGVALISFGLLRENLPIAPAKISDSISGSYQGYCRNFTGRSGNLRLVISKDPAGKISGNINITGELYGSGNIEGQLSDNIISFHNTIESGLPDQLEKEKIEMSWTGNISGNVIEGDYAAAISPKLKFKGFHDQQGKWKVTKIGK